MEEIYAKELKPQMMVYDSKDKNLLFKVIKINYRYISLEFISGTTENPYLENPESKLFQFNSRTKTTWYLKK